MEEIAETIARSLESGNRRREMAASSQELVDGEGSARVLMRLEGRSLRLRVLGEADCQLLWEWANDPEVRTLSFSSEPIPQWQHVQWFKTKLSDPNCLIYLAIDRDDIPIGQIRYEIENNEAVVSVSIDRKFRNRGYGSTLIQLASQQAFHIANLARIHAYIKPVNQASIRAFVKANFINFGISQVKGVQAVHLCKERE
jgi:RimJ/RimL family protein N-acetyltransferase